LPGWAAKPAKAPVLLVYKAEDEQARIVLSDKALLLGRKVENAPERGTLRLDHDSISREHAVVVHAFQGESFVCDLQSRYGTKLNGEKLQPRAYVPLLEGAELQFGESTRRYVFYREPPAKVKSSEPVRSAPAAASKSVASVGPASSLAAPKRTTEEEDGDDEDPMAGYQDDESDESSSESDDAGAADASQSERKVDKKARQAEEKARRKALKAEMKAEEKERVKALKKAETADGGHEGEASDKKEKRHKKHKSKKGHKEKEPKEKKHKKEKRSRSDRDHEDNHHGHSKRQHADDHIDEAASGSLLPSSEGDD
jgi:pSer/pThr/pTyr-binding forkhead associated (FHA) protein